MQSHLTAIELIGTVDDQQRLVLDQSLPVTGPQRVRVIALYPSEDGISERDWLRSAACNAAFADLSAHFDTLFSRL